MNENLPSAQGPSAKLSIFPFASAGGQINDLPQIAFDRYELGQILSLYGKMVAAGEWRDYSIDFLRDKAVFCIFRRSAEEPLFRVEKAPKLAKKQGAYSVIAAGGLILKRGHELGKVLRVFDRKLKVVK